VAVEMPSNGLVKPGTQGLKALKFLKRGSLSLRMGGRLCAHAGQGRLDANSLQNRALRC
jgi:hypothetical protein